MPGVVEEYKRTQEAIQKVESTLHYREQSYAQQTEFDRALYARAWHLQDKQGLRAEQAILTAGAEMKERGYGQGLSEKQSAEKMQAGKQAAFEEGFKRTKERLEERYFNASTSNTYDAHLGKAERWTNAEERGFVQKLSHSENQFISRGQFETPGGRYATDVPYRHGAREAVMNFSQENNHRLLETERQREREHQHIRIKVA